MHYTGTIWRPPYEACSALIQVTAGCTHHKCKFCTLYHDLPFRFRMSPLADVESDLQEAQLLSTDPIALLTARLQGLPRPEHIRRAFLTGANPFVLSGRRLMDIAELIQKYMPSIKTIGCFARITDVTQKSDEELASLRQAGYDGLTIGIETGDNKALAFMEKGYESAAIVKQCRRLDGAGIGYAFFYLAGISGAGRGIEGARATAAVANETRPWLIGANMLTVYENSELHREIVAGNWQEAAEVEKYEEVKELVGALSVPTEFAMLGASNPVMLQGRLPEQREQILAALDAIITDIGEERLRTYRANLRHL